MRPRGRKLGHGGVEYIARVWRATNIVKVCAISRRQRMGRLGARKGGRRGVVARRLEANLRACCRVHRWGPMREGVLWTNLSLRELSRRLLALGTPASRRTIRRLLRKLQVGRRTARKKRRWVTIPIATRNSKTSSACDARMKRLAMR